MKIIYQLLIFIFTLESLEAACISDKVYDLTFYIESNTNAILTCDNRSPVNAVLSYPINGPPVLVSIWDFYPITSNYHCEMIEYFFIAAQIISATIDTYSDDVVTVKINDVQVTEILDTPCSFQLNKDVTSYLKPGFNVLYIMAHDHGGTRGYFGYRLKIKAKFTVV